VTWFGVAGFESGLSSRSRVATSAASAACAAGIQYGYRSGWAIVSITAVVAQDQDVILPRRYLYPVGVTDPEPPLGHLGDPLPVPRITVLSYSPLAVSRCCGDRMPSELVGVAGFEPAASSSRITQTFE
jgi:hypothetical protein